VPGEWHAVTESEGRGPLFSRDYTNRCALFLLARIAEREEVAHRSIGMGFGHRGVLGPDAELARCKRERAIVAEFDARDQDVELMLGPDTRRQREWVGLQLAVRLLAAAYDNHPDYPKAHGAWPTTPQP